MRPPTQDRMLFSLPRTVAVVVFALLSSAMAAAPPANSLDDRVEELAVKVNELALAAKSKDVSAKKVCAHTGEQCENIRVDCKKECKDDDRKFKNCYYSCFHDKNCDKDCFT